jgi:hypothetical protein
VSSTVFVTTIVTLGVFMLGTVLAVIHDMGHRIDRLEDRLEDRLGRLEAKLSALGEDVAILKNR